MAKIKALIIVIAVALVTACSSGSTATGIGVGGIAGAWTFSLSPSTGGPRIQVTGGLVDTNGTISGTVAATGNPACFQGGAVTGSIDGNQLILTFTDDDLGSIINLSGTLNGSGGAGNWSLSSGPAECLNLAGAWRASKA